jgi:hypothetical protein
VGIYAGKFKKGRAGGITQKRFVMLAGTYKHAPAQDAAFRAKLRDMLMTF